MDVITVTPGYPSLGVSTQEIHDDRYVLEVLRVVDAGRAVGYLPEQVIGEAVQISAFTVN